ncbi:MAG: hypothetical protein A2W17_01655 [Planctomycetes bacterium RBG_16_41_13]|nr:MAG: hypothetical protein A2W17_01655 [Planctomycetes bacterium RBG_16_41_13]
MKTTILSTGILAFLSIAISLWTLMAFQFEPKVSLKGFQSPIVAIGLASSPQVFSSIVGDTQDPNCTIVRKSLRADYVFIAVYWLLYVSMSILFAGCNCPGAYQFGIAAGVCITAAAVFDVFENSYIAQMLSLPATDNGHDVINKLRHASLAKWTLIFVTTALVSQLFIRRNDWIAFIGYLFVLATALGLSGLLYNPAIEWASLPMGIGIVMTAVVFTFCPKKFLREF